MSDVVARLRAVSTPPGDAAFSIALRRHDIDTLGHVNQAVYHELLEDARVAFLEPIMVHEDESFVLARIELDYRHEVRYDAGHVDIVVRVAELGTRSVTLENEMLLPDGTVAASGKAIVVAWDMKARRSRLLTQAERDQLGALLEAAAPGAQP
jgi:acyl-CoA thioester hydrolase